MELIKTGNLITKRRMMLHMSQAQLAEALDVCDKTISKWENGYYPPNIQIIENLCLILGISIEEFFRGEEFDSGLEDDNNIECDVDSMVQVIRN